MKKIFFIAAAISLFFMQQAFAQYGCGSTPTVKCLGQQPRCSSQGPTGFWYCPMLEAEPTPKCDPSQIEIVTDAVTGESICASYQYNPDDSSQNMNLPYANEPQYPENYPDIYYPDEPMRPEPTILERLGGLFGFFTPPTIEPQLPFSGYSGDQNIQYPQAEYAGLSDREYKKLPLERQVSLKKLYSEAMDERAQQTYLNSQEQYNDQWPETAAPWCPEGSYWGNNGATGANECMPYYANQNPSYSQPAPQIFPCNETLVPPSPVPPEFFYQPTPPQEGYATPETYDPKPIAPPMCESWQQAVYPNYPQPPYCTPSVRPLKVLADPTPTRFCGSTQGTLNFGICILKKYVDCNKNTEFKELINNNTQYTCTPKKNCRAQDFANLGVQAQNLCYLAV